MDTQPVDTLALPSDRDPQRDRAFQSVGRDDEILVCILAGDGAHPAFYVRAACDLVDCLDLAHDFARIRGVRRVSFRARFTTRGVFEWSWTRRTRGAR